MLEMSVGRFAEAPTEPPPTVARGRVGADRGACGRELLGPPRRRSRFRLDSISFRLPGRTSILITREERDRFSTVTGGGRVTFNRMVLDDGALAASPERLSRAESSRSVTSVDWFLRRFLIANVASSGSAEPDLRFRGGREPSTG